MKIPNAYCKKHDEIEPQDHDFYIDGLWTCPKCITMPLKHINGLKPLDYALKQLPKELKNGN